jgi:hypothetical protein
MSLNIRVTESPDGGRCIEISEPPAPAEIHVHPLMKVSAIADQRAPAAAAARTGPRFVKIDAAGDPLPADASSWAAVHDTRSGLTWSADNVAGKRLEHADATAACTALDLAGAKDWRLPTRTELLTLVDDTTHNPAIDKAMFPTTEAAYYWTASPCAWRPGSAAWCVGFYDGDVYHGGRGCECFVRAVRVASPAAGQ